MQINLDLLLSFINKNIANYDLCYISNVIEGQPKAKVGLPPISQVINVINEVNTQKEKIYYSRWYPTLKFDKRLSEITKNWHNMSPDVLVQSLWEINKNPKPFV